MSQPYDEVEVSIESIDAVDLPDDETVDALGASVTRDAETGQDQDVAIEETQIGLDAAEDASENEGIGDGVRPEDAPVGLDVDDDEAADDGQLDDPEADAVVEQADEAPEPEVVAAVLDEAEEAQEAGEVSAEDAEPDILQDFRDRLYTQFGDWFVVHTYSGMENRVKTNLENRITSLNMEEFIFEVVVPTEEVAEIKNGQRKLVKRTVLPGYVLVRMDLTDESWSAVRHTPSVTGFVGNAHQPVPLSLAEVESMLAPAVEAEAAASEATSDSVQQAKTPKVEFTDFAVSDSVMVVDGPFATLHATITEINIDAARVKALVEIFGRETPVELSFTQIQRV